MLKPKRAVTVTLITLGVLAMAGMALWVGIGIVSVAGIETPHYVIESERDGYEIRRYAPYIAAEVEMEGSFDTSMNGGFRKLADYIFGNNTAAGARDAGQSEKIDMTAPVLERPVRSEKIEMTAPVVEQARTENSRIVSFIMPGKYAIDTLPKPNNPDVRLVEIPAKRYAVIRFTGSVTSEVAEKQKKALVELLVRDNVETAGPPMLAQYNPPWTPPLMRRNEVMVELPAAAPIRLP